MTAPAKFLAHSWKPGQSGNPHGRMASAAYRELRALARQKAPLALQRLGELAQLDRVDRQGELKPLLKKSELRVVAAASKTVLEWAWGAAPPYDPSKEVDDTQKPVFDPRLLNPEELDLVETALRLMVRATRKPGEAIEMEPVSEDEPQCEAQG